MDTTIKALYRDLSRKLVEVGNRLDTTKNPEEMKALITHRKRLRVSLAVVEASLARVRVANLMCSPDQE